MSNLMSYRGYSPLREFSRMQSAMDHLFDDYYAPASRSSSLASYAPKCEVTEDKSNYYVKFDLPGMPKDQIKIDLQDGQLTVSGERKEEKRDEKKKYTEMSYGSFLRSFTLPTPVDSEKVQASYDNGVLSITVAKAENSKARQITIK